MTVRPEPPPLLTMTAETWKEISGTHYSQHHLYNFVGPLISEVEAQFEEVAALRETLARLTEERDGLRCDLGTQIAAKADVAKEAVRQFAEALAERDRLTAILDGHQQWLAGPHMTHRVTTPDQACGEAVGPLILAREFLIEFAQEALADLAARRRSGE